MLGYLVFPRADLNMNLDITYYRIVWRSVTCSSSTRLTVSPEI
ncbi:unnamed protein product [Acanthoscelides obtectus]|uniref:Uncharacterized protein n=1 Tax=Acanthoscelides obtectus TaxID=200917 RepID=A0A9P0LSM3_ACAOB|nr:unnamed protein product [Acanthoscelides obtectus]CAH2001873.1 unnamed protein product [Acanthoscelides obtectus]CAK1677851.1 hypothetical protein AOBTE_LOCUS31589 [Acanthoscelides obtectus]CAK1677868.1 hypothetical protein AOBTE_LOCUS31601 [Acanthoscelides obtectus]